jgi:hypothetical protein
MSTKNTKDTKSFFVTKPADIFGFILSCQKAAIQIQATWWILGIHFSYLYSIGYD